MIDPVVAVSALIAFALTAGTVVLTRRVAERHHEEPVEREQRYVNGGWH